MSKQKILVTTADTAREIITQLGNTMKHELPDMLNKPQYVHTGRYMDYEVLYDMFQWKNDQRVYIYEEGKGLVEVYSFESKIVLTTQILELKSVLLAYERSGKIDNLLDPS